MDKRHFTVVIGSKEHGLYISSKPSSAAKKAVSKLCASNKSKKVEFCLREITQGSKKKTYGPYLGEMKKLKTPIELKGRVIRHEIKVHLKKGKSSTRKTVKKMRGGEYLIISPEIRSSLIEMNNYQEVLNAVFNSHEFLNNLYETEILRNSSGLGVRNNKGQLIQIPTHYPYEFIKKMIDQIDTFEDKYKFIICFICSISLRKYMIEQLGLDKIIEIIFNIDYNEQEFRNIVEHTGHSTITHFNFQSKKKSIFPRLFDFYKARLYKDSGNRSRNTYSESDKEKFQEVLIKLLSIQNQNFMDFPFFINFAQSINSYNDESFKLFDFLLNNKQSLLEFIKKLKIYYTHIENPLSGIYHIQIDQLLLSEKQGTTQTRDELFRNV
jgi:hypothetical protein